MKTILNRIEKEIKRKISRNDGDSIAEVLIALLISSLALVMLASMITSSSRMITGSREKLETYYENSSSLNEIGTSNSTTVSVTGDVAQKYSVYYSVNNTFSNRPVVSFQYNGVVAG